MMCKIPGHLHCFLVYRGYGWMDGWLGFNGILSTQVAAISCPRSTLRFHHPSPRLSQLYLTSIHQHLSNILLCIPWHVSMFHWATNVTFAFYCFHGAQTFNASTTDIEETHNDNYIYHREKLLLTVHMLTRHRL